MTKNIKVAHLTSAHADNDIRIFYKECVSLAEAGYDVTEVTLSGTAREEKGVRIVSANFKPTSRLDRMRNASKKILELALEVDADIYHFHDPELLRVGLKLRKKGKIVIYDAHEDTPRQILSKPYLNATLRKGLSYFYERLENRVARQMSAVVTVTPFIMERYLKLNKRTIQVCNFPLFSEVNAVPVSSPEPSAETHLCYIGGISVQRGIREMIKVASQLGVTLDIAGRWHDDIKGTLEKEEGWENVIDHGFINRQELAELMQKAYVGLVTLHPEENYITSYPIKMFEYMSAGLPVIASDFPLWKSIIDGAQCGICVDPLDIKAFSEAVQYLMDHPEEAKKMGERGRQAVIEKYNWDIEKQKLFDLYTELLQEKATN